jgi:hypothetical protein
MRLYKAFLDDTYKVISYVEPSDSELIYSERLNQTYEIFLEDISDYIKLNGYITVPSNDKGKYCMFLDIDHNFSNVWDTETSIYVQDQIVTDIRHKLIDAYFSNDEEKLENIPSDEMCKLQGIIGLSSIYVGDETYMYHRHSGGVWESSSSYIASIDRNTGILEANFPGKTTITYVVDTGCGILTCYKTIEILRKL